VIDRGQKLPKQTEKRKLVVFDVEGVLVPKRRYLFLEVGRILGFKQFLTIVFYGFLYEVGVISLKSALEHVFRAFRGVKTQELIPIFRQIPLIPGAKQVFQKLKAEGFTTALISSGLPTMVVDDLAQELKADFSYGLEVETMDDALTGEIWGDVLERNGKLVVLEKILKATNLTQKNCIVVADDRNNRSIFLPEAFKIAYHPDFDLITRADKVVNGSLPEILPPILGQPDRSRTRISFSDIVRETIHASGILMPIIAIHSGKYYVAYFILIITLLYIMSELARVEKKSIPLFSWITRHAATQSELGEFATTPLLFAAGIVLTLLIYPAQASGAAIAAFALGDSTASLGGKAFGRTYLSINKGKTLEGSLTGFVFAFLGALIFVPPWLALIGAAAAMMIELLPLPLNDNLVIPLVTGAILTPLV
jgi:dolichol kinase/phosphoserine phosphatase